MSYFVSSMMPYRTIRLLYRKIIDVNAQTVWDKYIFDATYNEFVMQSAYFNQQKQYSTFAELKNNMPAAEKLHHLVSAAIIGYLKQLNGTVPDILNNLGRYFLKFENYKFEIIDSDINHKNKHRVAIDFISDPLLWIDTIDNQLLVSKIATAETADGLLTDLFSLQPYLSIYAIKEASA